MRNVCRAFVLRADPAHIGTVAEKYGEMAQNMTHEWGILSAVNGNESDTRNHLLAQFADKFSDDALVMDKYFALVGLSRRSDTSLYMHQKNKSESSKDEVGIDLVKDYFKEEWYTQAIKAGKKYVSKPYMDDGNHLVTVSTPLMYKGKIVGIILVDIKTDEFKNIKATSEDYKTMFSCIINDHEQYKDSKRC